MATGAPATAWNCTLAGSGLCYRLAPRSGPCAMTALGGDCSVGVQGSWVSSNLTDCILRCAACGRCRHLSFSTRHSDCSWYASCPTTLHSMRAKYVTLDIRGFDPMALRAVQAHHAPMCRMHIHRLVEDPFASRMVQGHALPPPPPRPPASSSPRPHPIRLALAFVYFPSARGACLHLGRAGHRCAVPAWCAAAARLQAALPQEWVVERVALVHTEAPLHSGGDGGGAAAAGDGGGGGNDNHRSGGRGGGCPLRGDELDARDCPGGLRIVRPEPALVDALRRHVAARLGNGAKGGGGKGGTPPSSSSRASSNRLLSATRRLIRTIVKWHFMASVEYDAVLLSDLDVDLLPVAALRGERAGWQTPAQVRQDWSERLPALLARRAMVAAAAGGGERDGRGSRGSRDGGAAAPIHAVFSADLASPLNACLMLLLPSRALYEDGLSVLASPFSVDRGWNLSGTPAAVLGAAPLLFVDGRAARHVTIGRYREWSFTNADADQGLFAYMLLGRHRVGRYSRLERRPPVAYVHHHFAKPWAQLRFLQGGRRSEPRAAPPASSSRRATAWPHGWHGAALSQACTTYRYLRAATSPAPHSAAKARRGIEAEWRADAAAAAPSCLREMRRELSLVEAELRRVAARSAAAEDVNNASTAPMAWPLCVEDCKLAVDNPGSVLFQRISVF